MTLLRTSGCIEKKIFNFAKFYHLEIIIGNFWWTLYLLSLNVYLQKEKIDKPDKEMESFK